MSINNGASADPMDSHNNVRRSRTYSTNVISRDLNASLESFVAELSRLQRNLYERDSVKGKFRRRYYAGFKEAERRLPLKKLKLVVVASDVDVNRGDGELGELVHRFVDACRRHETPVVFGLTRRKMGYLTHGKGFVGCIAVANYEALEEKLEDALKHAVEARNAFKVQKEEPDKTIDLTKILTDDLLVSERVKVLLKALVYNQ